MSLVEDMTSSTFFFNGNSHFLLMNVKSTLLAETDGSDIPEQMFRWLGGSLRLIGFAFNIEPKICLPTH